MGKYLSTIHQRPTGHKKLFALAVSGSITLAIFGFWSLATFGRTSSTIAETPRNTGTLEAPMPIDEIKSGLANSYEALRGQINSLQESVKNINNTDATYYGQQE